MKKVIVSLIVVLFLFSMIGAAFAHPLGGPPGLARRAAVSEPATLTVTFDSGEVIVVEGVAQGQTVQFAFAGTGIITDMVAEQNGRITYWSGQGSEYADMSEFDEALWQVVWTSGGAFGRGRQVLTIGYAEGFIYDEPVDEEPIDDEEPEDEEPEE
jgi:hypothetical protein